MSSFRREFGLSVLVLTMAAGAVHACTVPVFRYALERWPPDVHVLSVRSNAVPKGVTSADMGSANLWIERADAQQAAEVRVAFPGTEESWYEGAWEDDLPTRLSDSPLSRRIGHELLTGATAVFVLLESSNAATNDAVRAMLDERMSALKKELKLPTDPDYEDEEDGSSGPYTGQPLGSIPLGVSFPLLSVSRQNESEQFLVAQIESLAEGMEDPDKVALAVVFGCGRAIPLPADILSGETVDQLCWFLVGACSCQVKAMNPGIDLLMSVNWLEAMAVYPEAVKNVLPDGREFYIGGTGQVAFAEGAVAGVDASAGDQNVQAQTPTRRAPAIVLVLIASAVVCGISLRRRWKKGGRG